MSRRRSGDPVRRPALHPLLQAVLPLRPEELRVLMLREREAVAALVAGEFDSAPEHLHVLRVSAAVAERLAVIGYGADELQRVRSLIAALAHALPGDFHAHATEAGWLLDFHDAQRAVASSRDYLGVLAGLGQLRR